MTQTNLTILFILIIAFAAIAAEYYKVVVKKKNLDKALAGRILFFTFFFFFINSHASYFTSLAKYNRTENNIPPIPESMELKKRSRFKEVWINKDTSTIKHALKIIRLGNSIEKEIDFFTNAKIAKTLKIKSTFPFLSNDVNQKYFLIVGLETDENRFNFNLEKKELNSFQKDSVLNEWNLNYQIKEAVSSTIH